MKPISATVEKLNPVHLSRAHCSKHGKLIKRFEVETSFEKKGERARLKHVFFYGITSGVNFSLKKKKQMWT